MGGIGVPPSSLPLSGLTRSGLLGAWKGETQRIGQPAVSSRVELTGSDLGGAETAGGSGGGGSDGSSILPGPSPCVKGGEMSMRSPGLASTPTAGHSQAHTSQWSVRIFCGSGGAISGAVVQMEPHLHVRCCEFTAPAGPAERPRYTNMRCKQLDRWRSWLTQCVIIAVGWTWLPLIVKRRHLQMRSRTQSDNHFSLRVLFYFYFISVSFAKQA